MVQRKGDLKLEIVVHVSWPERFEGEHVFENLEELKIWLESFFHRYGTKSREKHIEGIIESVKRRGYVAMTATGWYGFRIETRK